MDNRRRQRLVNLLKVFDLSILVVCFVLATVPVVFGPNNAPLREFFSLRIKVQNFILFSGLLLVWHIIFSSLGLYQPNRLLPRRSEILVILKATSLTALCTAMAKLFFTIRMVNPTFLFAFWILASVAEVTLRLALRCILDHLRVRGHNLRHVLIVGTNSRTAEFATKLEARREYGYRILGFVDEEREGFEHPSEYPVVCNFQGFMAYIRSSIVDEVVIGLPLQSFYYEASRIAAACEVQGIIVRFLPSIFNLKVARPRAEDFEGDSLITLSTGPADGWPVVIKRILDVSVSLILIAVLAPLLLVTAILIKLTSPGSVLFTQERLGLNKRKFRVYKFRTMSHDAEERLADVEHLNEVSGPVFKIKNDPRITPFGKFLRKSSIDELPQLLNVLKGDMSLVGPRPLPVRDYDGFDQDWHRRRFSVRPGITCLWQVSGRSSIGFDRWMELDMQYIDEWSLWLDLKILAGTIPAVLKGSGAA